LPFCGTAQSGTIRSLCSIDPVAIPACAPILGLARVALRDHAKLVAYQRPVPIAVRGDETTWPGYWLHDPAGRTLTPTTAGADVAHIAVSVGQRYGLWLGGNFARGFDVSVDGRRLGRVKNELADFNQYIHVSDLYLSHGVHTVVLTYPRPDLTPGSGSELLTSLAAIVLQPLESTPSQLLTVGARQAKSLCGRPLDWLEIVA
jgi:hypothetical protein